MSHADVMQIAQQALFIAAKLASPILLVSLALGVFISLIQAVTQVQEMTLTFVPKLAGISAVLVLAGGWMLSELSSFTRALFESIPRLVA